MNPIRSIVAVMGGIAVISLVVEALEFTLVTAVSGGSIADMTGYFAVRNTPTILTAKVLYNTLAAVLGGYVTAKIAGTRELIHTGVAAVIQTVALIWGFTAGEYASFTPAWTRIVLVLLTGPAMMAGGTIRSKAAGD